MAIKILNAKKLSVKLKVTIQQTGKLGFTEETAKELELSPDRYIRFAQDDANGQLYLAVHSEENVDSFKVCSSGRYYYLQTTAFFRTLEYDFTNKTIMFDLSREESLDEMLGGKSYIMTMRINDRKAADVE